MFRSWTYLEYKAAVKSGVDFALDTHGFNPAQAISFAHHDLLVRLDDLPSELPLALVALASEANARKLLGRYPADHPFVEEVVQNLEPSVLEEVRRNLSGVDRETFDRDANLIRQVLGSSGQKV